MALNEADLNTLGQAVLGELMNALSIPQIRLAAGKAGLNAGEIPAQESRAAVVPTVQRLYAQLPPDRKETALRILAESIAANSESHQRVQQLLQRHGFQFIDGIFLPVGTIDALERYFLPATAFDQITSALNRLANGDESGAITDCCGAVDATTTTLFQRYSLGDPRGAFQAKINTVLTRLMAFERMKQELLEVGLTEPDAERICTEIREATKHAAEALQVIRRTMGDVHGKKPATSRMVYDSIKWASAICGLLEGL
jgi:hypothetical protein